jgi:dihydrolipoamide dehydrogenase
VSVPTDGTAGASFVGRSTGGTAQLVGDTERGVVVGATFVGFEVGEWLQAATIAIVGEVPIDRLWHCVPAFPPRSEVWLRLLEAYEAG